MKHVIHLALVLACSLGVASRAHALIINQNDPQLYAATLAPPPDDPGWANVGSLNGATGVYLGNGYVLTASHVGAGTIGLRGQNYNYDGQGVTQLNNPSTNSPTDLVLFHLDRLPDLSALSLNSNTALSANQPFLLIANGLERGTQQPDGFSYSGTANKRWGTNTLAAYQDIGAADGYPYGEVRSLTTDFSQNPGSYMAGNNPVNEAQVAGGDSGGAMFFKDANGWQLGGIIFAKGRDDAVMTSTDAAFGDITFAADIATYRSQIVSITAVPEPSTCFLMSIGMLCLFWPLRHRTRLKEPFSMK